MVILYRKTNFRHRNIDSKQASSVRLSYNGKPKSKYTTNCYVFFFFPSKKTLNQISPAQGNTPSAIYQPDYTQKLVAVLLYAPCYQCDNGPALTPAIKAGLHATYYSDLKAFI